MGRVYNALVRAEKWKDGDRPIGRPDRNGPTSVAREDTAQGLSFNSGSAAANSQAAFENALPKTEVAGSSVAARSVLAAESIELPQSDSAPRPSVIDRKSTRLNSSH